MISTTFDKVTVKGQFVCNGTEWVKRSKRTASIFGQPNKWFYSEHAMNYANTLTETKGV